MSYLRLDEAPLVNKKVLPLPLSLLLPLLALNGPVQLVGFLPLSDIDDLLLHVGSPESLIVLILRHEVPDFTVQVVLLGLVLFKLA